MLFWNRWNQEAAGRVYFNISREKPTHTPDTPHVQPLSDKLEWTNQKHFYCFCWKQSKTVLLQGSPKLLISLLYMHRRALGRDCFSRGVNGPCTVRPLNILHFLFYIQKPKKPSHTLIFLFLLKLYSPPRLDVNWVWRKNRAQILAANQRQRHKELNLAKSVSYWSKGSAEIANAHDPSSGVPERPGEELLFLGYKGWCPLTTPCDLAHAPPRPPPPHKSLPKIK